MLNHTITCLMPMFYMLQQYKRRLVTRKLTARPPVKRCMDCDKTTETCTHILTPHERTFILVF